MSNKLVWNSISGVALYVTNVVSAFIISPIILRSLGNWDYGLWEMIMSIIGYMGLLDLGVGPALVRFVAVADGRQDWNDLQKTISTALAFFVVLAIVASIFLLILGLNPEWVAGEVPDTLSSLSVVFFLLAFNAAVLFPQQVFIATLLGVQCHFLINNWRIFFLIVRSFLTYYLLLRYPGHGLVVIALLEPLFSVLQLLVFFGAVLRDRGIPCLAFSAVSYGKVKELFVFAGKSVVMMAASRLQNQSVPLIVGKVVGLGHVVYFVMPNRLVDYAKGLALAVGYPLTPYFGASIGKGDQNNLLKSWLTTSLALQVVSLAMPVVLFFCGEPFLRLWIGEEYAVAGRYALYFLLIGLVVDGLTTNAYRMLTAQGKHGKCALIWFFLSVLSIPVGIVGAMIWGVSGVVAGTTFVTIIGGGVTLHLACAVMKISMGLYFASTIKRIVLPLLLFVGMFLLCRYLVYISSYLDLIVHVVMSGVVYLMSIWFFTLDGNMRENVVKHFSRRFRFPS